MRFKVFHVSWCFLALMVAISSSSTDENLMTDMTEAVFGTQNNLNIFPMAFLDFDGDRLTDLIVISENSKTLSVYLAVRQSFLGIKAPYYDTNIKGKNMDCQITDGKIVSVVPGDYDGDGYSDILVVIKKADTENLFAFVIWTDRSEDMKNRILNCSTLQSKGIEMAQQPIVLDANGDNIADLFGVDQHNTKGFWIFSPEQEKPPTFVAAEPVVGSQTKSGNGAHSNAFVDLNEDGNADIFTTNKNRFEIWQNVGGLSSVVADDQNANKSDVPEINFRFHRVVDIDDCDDYCLVGQVSFSDFDMNGRLDMLVPVCQDGIECRKPALLFGRVDDVFHGGNDFKFEKVELNLGNWTFDFRTDKEQQVDPFRLLTPRPGDLNLDGYADLLLRMKNTITEEVNTHFLLNIGREIGKDTKFGRAFQLQAEIMKGLSNVIAATFFDIYDNGILDILTLTEDKIRHTYKIGAYSNKTLTSSGYFMKVIVLSGICYKNCADQETIIPYGANMPGQIVCYKTQGNNLAPQTSAAFDSCMPQLTMTAHTPLQLPFTHFGLGSNLNFIESLGVKVTNASSRSESREFVQILIPNAQLYVIPYPPQDPDSWKLKLFITASSNIMWTVLTLVIGAIIMIIFIVGFVFQEKKVDRLEKLNDRGKYHFTPM